MQLHLLFQSILGLLDLVPSMQTQQHCQRERVTMLRLILQKLKLLLQPQQARMFLFILGLLDLVQNIQTQQRFPQEQVRP